MISSEGGNVTDGLAIYNAIKSFEKATTVIVDGMALSAASLIAMAGQTIKAYSTSVLMIHRPKSGAYGEESDLESGAEGLRRTHEVMAIAYTRGGKIEKESVETWMKAKTDTYFSAAQALEAGLIDEVIDDANTASRAKRVVTKLATYNGVPGEIMHLLTAAAAAAADPTPPTPTPTPDAIAAERERIVGITAAYESHGETHKALRDECIADAAVTVDVAKTKLEEAIAAASPPTPVPPTPTPEPGVTASEAAIRAGIRAERERTNGITAAFKRFAGHDTLRDECISDGTSIAAARDKLLTALTDASTAEGGTQGFRVTSVVDSRDKYLEGALEAFMIRGGGIVDKKEAKQKADANEFMGWSLYDHARHCLQAYHSQPERGDKLSIVGEAFGRGVDDFDLLLENTAHKYLLMGYMETEEVYPQLARIVSMSDFKEHSFPNLSNFSDLKPIGEFTEYEMGDFQEIREKAILKTYGRLFGLSRRSIINDDLDAFSRIPRAMGRAARRQVGDLFAEVFTSNQVLDQDNKAIFHADHNNIAALPPSTEAFKRIRVSMARQKDPNGVTVPFRPKCAYCAESVREQIQLVNASTTEIKDNQNNSRRPNVMMGLFPDIVSDYRLDDDSTTQWYAIADAQMYDTVMVGMLDGRDEPYFERQDQFTRDGVMWKVRMDAVAKALDFRSMYRANA